ncbi:hypothetical protein MMC20_004698 [Loxospora ochrophaea]|nr:hypothetical protein [Loxospora ochrophaea]
MHERDLKFQDLASLFSENMRFSDNRPQENRPDDGVINAFQHSQEPHTEQSAPQIIYSISQHYHHSAHLVPSNTTSSASEVITVESAHEEIAKLLLQNNVDPCGLSSSQLALFEHADPEQKQRLIELWRISAPVNDILGEPGLANEMGGHQCTTMEQEEEMAKLRYESMMSRKQPEPEGIQMQEMWGQDPQSSLSPIHENIHRTAEPYIASGYEQLAQRDYDQQAEELGGETQAHFGSAVDEPYNRALDPVHQSREWWHNFVGQQSMEHQYGMFDQLNQFRSPSQQYGGVQGTEDEEML